MLTVDARGVFPIAPTPFMPDGRIDERERRPPDGLLCRSRAPTAARSSASWARRRSSTPSEALRSSRRAASVGRRSCRSSSASRRPGFAAMRALARAAMEQGAAGVMIAPPPALRTDDQIVGYYAQAVEAIGADIPFVIQDYPLTLSVVMTPGVIRRIVTDNPSCVMLKHEDWPGLEKISALRAFERDGAYAARLDSDRQRRAVPRFRDGARRRRRDDRLRLSRNADRRRPSLASEGGAKRRTICSTPICRCCATSSSRASASRCANT